MTSGLQGLRAELKSRRVLLEAVVGFEDARQLETIRRVLTQAPGPRDLVEALDAGLRRPRQPGLLERLDATLEWSRSRGPRALELVDDFAARGRRR